MYNVVYLQTARKQPEGTAMYIAMDLCPRDAALALLDEVDSVVQRLTEMPYRYPVYRALLP